jgi:hypothetical protein
VTSVLDAEIDDARAALTAADVDLLVEHDPTVAHHPEVGRRPRRASSGGRAQLSGVRTLDLESSAGHRLIGMDHQRTRHLAPAEMATRTGLSLDTLRASGHSKARSRPANARRDILRRDSTCTNDH